MSRPSLIYTRDAAKRLHVTPRTVARWVDAGIIDAVAQAPGRSGAYLFDADKIDTIAEARAGASRDAEEVDA